MNCDIIGDILFELEETILDHPGDIKYPLDVLKQIKDKYEINNVDPFLSELIDEVNILFRGEGFSAISPTYLEYIIKTGHDAKDNSEIVPDTTERLDDSKKETLDLLDNIFKGANHAREVGVNRIKYSLRKAIFFGENNYIEETNEFNSEIKKYQNSLLQDIIKYLRIKNKSVEKTDLYDNDGNYTGVIEEISKDCEEYFKNLSAKEILQMFLSNRPAFDAFVAYNVLLNFDNFLIYFLGNQIKIINYTEQFTKRNKYGLNPALTNVMWTTETSDEIEVSESLNNLTKFFIETTPKYDFKTKSIKPDEFVKFQDFIDLICKIKSLAWEIDTIQTDRDQYSFREMLAEAQLDDSKWVEIFDIVSKLYNNKLSESQKNTLYSLQHEIFGSNNENLKGLRNLVNRKNLWGGTYYDYILQTINSITPVNNSFYLNDENFCFLQEMKSSNVDSQQFQLNIQFNIINNPSVKKYSVTGPKINLVNGEYILDSINIPFEYKFNDNLTIKIDNKGEIVPKITSENFNDFAEFVETVLQIPILSENGTSDFFNTFKYVSLQKLNILSGSDIENLKRLVSFAAQLVKGNYVLQQIEEEVKQLKDKNKTRDVILKIANLYYDGKLKINDKIQNLDIVPTNNLNVLEDISQTISILNGVYTGALVKDSQGNSLATSATNRLMGTLLNLFNRIKSDPNCPANHLMLINNIKLFKGIYSIRDIKYNEFDSKSAIKCNARELGEIGILFDFLFPLLNNVNKSNSGNLSKGNIAVLTSVNSDKPTLAKLLLDVEELLKILEVNLELFIKEDFIIDELKKITNDELGTYYTKIINNIEEDLLKLSTSETFLNILPGFTLRYNIESYQELSNKLNELGLNVEEFLNNCAEEANVQLNDQLHVIYNGNKVIPNYSLLSLEARYNENIEKCKELGCPTSEQFWKYMNKEVIHDLIKNKYKLDISKLKSLKLNSKTEINISEEWVSKSNYLIIGKGKTKNENWINIESEEDLKEEYIELKLNPLIEKYNLIDHLFSQEYLIGTVGTHINHPSKAKHKEFINYIEDEANRFQAQHKRNVSQTALVHIFNLNQINGIPDTYNIACIKDIADFAYNVYGEIGDLKPFDGATFVNGPVVYLENNSLNGEKAGIDKKQFIHFYEEKFGTGGIIKTAGFGIINSKMRNSPFLEKMFQKMNELEWTDENGNLINIDITQGNQNRNEYGEFVEDDDITNLYEIFYRVPIKTENGWEYQYRQITNISYNGSNSYTLTVKIVNEFGKVIGDAKPETVEGINNNYALWKKIFKGLDSVSINEDTKKLSSSAYNGEQSMVNLVNAINRIGFRKEGPLNQKNYYLPLKHNMIHYVVTEGAIKQGAANMNNSNQYYDNKKLRYFKIKMRNGGILLDKQHHADNSEVSIMTQVISACAALGYNWNESNELYEALHNLALQGIDEVYKEDNDIIKNKTLLATILVKQLANGTRDKDGLIFDVCKDLISEYIRNGKLNPESVKNTSLPISDLALFDKVLSMISSVITRMSIKLKFSGVLSVLHPSHEIIKLYAGKLKSQYVNFDAEIDEIEQENIPINKVEMGVTYIVSNGEETKTVHIQAPNIIRAKKSKFGNPNIEYIGYYDFKEKYKGWSIKEDIKQGRNLLPYNVFFTGSSGEQYSYYDIKLVKDVYSKEKITKEDRKIILKILNSLEIGKSVSIVSKNANGIEEVTPIEITSLEIRPFECVMPKLAAEKLGLKVGDNLTDILNDPDFFTRRLSNNLKSKISDIKKVTAILKKPNGKHVYLINSNNDAKKILGLNKNSLFKPIVDETGVYYYKQNGDKLYLSSTNDRIYMLDGQEVILTSNIDFYLENEDYTTIESSRKVLTKNNINNKAFKNWKKTGNDIDLNILGAELHTSFQKMLEVIAARIPAQSMQSFMAMKVVAFEDFDINTAYVSTHQIWLQGSDFDIDCVTLLAYELNKAGKFVGWSPYFDLNNITLLNLSMQLKYPTGKELEFSNNNFKSDIDLLKQSLNIFDENGDLSLYETSVDIINKLSKQGSIIDYDNLTDLLKSQLKNELLIDDVKNHINRVKKIVDIHNKYKVNQEIFTKNFIVSKIWNIILNPKNQIQATTSVDKTVDEPKSIADLNIEKLNQLKVATPGNFHNKLSAIESNQVGKDVIGISAVSLKSFFAWTQYCNTILNEGTNEEIELLFKKKINFNGKKYSIANLNYNTQRLKDFIKPGMDQDLLDFINSNDNLTNNDIINWIRNSQNEEDAALKLSALLSLATDNAKELCLAKLNADVNLADMYLFGLSIGIDFKELADLLMSDFGNSILSYLKGSIISNEIEFKTIEDVYKFLINPEKAAQKLFLIYYSEIINGKYENLFNSNSYLGWIHGNNAEETKEILNNFTQKDLYPIGIISKLIKLDSKYCKICVNNLKNRPNFSYKFIRLLDSIMEANITYNKMKKLDNFEMQCLNFIELRLGSREMSLLGRLCGLNQGIKNKMEDYINFIDTFETLITQHNNLNKSYERDIKHNERIDLNRYMTDPEYKQEIIEKYDEISLIINPLRIIDKVPHYNSYLEAAYTKHKASSNSIQYRSAYHSLSDIRKYIGSSDIYSRFKSIYSLVNTELINEWFKLQNLSFILPKGLDLIILKQNGDIITNKRISVNEDTPVYLGTASGNATFKNLMESYVIPKLMLGHISDSNEKFYYIKNNKFIQSLIPNIYSKNITRHNSISYKSNVNMSPKNNFDKTILELMLTEFNELYSIEFTIGNKSIPIGDLFYLYNLISYGNKVGEGTFTKLFELKPGNLLKSLNKYIDSQDWDPNQRIIKFDSNILMRAAALRESRFSTFSKVIYEYNKNSLQIEFKTKLSSEENDDVFVSNEKFKPDFNLFTNFIDNLLLNNREILKYKNKEYQFELNNGLILIKNENGTVILIPIEITDNQIDKKTTSNKIKQFIDYINECHG